MSWQKKKKKLHHRLILRGGEGRGGGGGGGGGDCQECPKVSSSLNGNSLCPLVDTFENAQRDQCCDLNTTMKLAYDSL